jgi:protein-tyrosine-phosphatase/DNA-binding transcriptional ArsR family regulator
VPKTGSLTDPPEFVRQAAHPVRWRLLAALAEGDHRVRDLAAALDEPQNLVSYHLRLLRAGGLVTARRSSHDGRDSYHHLDLDRCATALAGTAAALHPALRGRTAPARPATGIAVLFVCTGNSARSPIAEALLRHRTAGGVVVASAGSHPGQALHPEAVRVLRERYGIDVAGQPPRHLDTFADHAFTHVITLCDKAKEVCPDFPGHPRRVHWSIPDPAVTATFDHTAADIDTRVRHLLPTIEEDRP